VVFGGVVTFTVPPISREPVMTLALIMSWCICAIRMLITWIGSLGTFINFCKHI